MKVSKYMTRKLVTARPEEGARHAFLRMRHEGVRHLPVVDGGGALVGWLSDRDLRRPDWADAEADLGFPWDLSDTVSVGDLMVPDPLVLHTYDSLLKAVNYLVETHYGALPVLDKTERLVGVLSVVDALRVFQARLQSEIAD